MATAIMDILVEGERITQDSEDDRFLRVSPLRDVASAPHSRSSSFKNRPRPKLCLDIAAAQRPRTNSLPNCPAFLPLPAPDWMPKEQEGGGLRRVRSFKTTSKGIVNHGDSFKRSTNSLASNGSIGSIDRDGANITLNTTTSRHRRHSTASDDSGPSLSNASVVTPSYYRVLMMGAAGTGKTALTRQFMTSEYKGTYENSTPEVEDDTPTSTQSVSVLLDNEESLVEFINEEEHPNADKEISIDAYVVVFSVTDPGTYNYAVNTVRKLRVESGVDRVIILVGNKIDLARQRRVTKHDATKLASKYDCRFTETSAALNHHVDELLVGIVSQIRQKLHPPDPSLLTPPEMPRCRSRSKSPGRAALTFFQKLFGTGSSSKNKAKSCETLFVK